MKSRKILFLCGDMDRSGGTERVLATLANTLARTGHDITILSVQGGLQPFFELDEAVKLDALFSTPSRYLKRYPAIVSRLRHRLRTGCFDILVDVEAMLTLVSLPAATGLKLRHICWDHFSFRIDLGRRLRRLARHLAAIFCDDVITLTEHDKRLWERSTWLRAALHALPNPTPFAPSSSPYPVDSRIVLSVGRPMHEKGHDLLLQAWSTIAHLAPDWTLRIVGHDDDLDTLRHVALCLGLQDRVQIVPPMHHIGAEYARAGIYCMSSRTEGFPLTLLEALSFGLPVAGFDCDAGPREILEGCGVTLVEPGNIEELGQALLSLIHDPRTRLALSALARMRAADFQVAAVIPQWQALLEHALDTSPWPESKPTSYGKGKAGAA